jgi:AcrR family transcriptional regulator
MPVDPKKAPTRALILAGAGRTFRSRGYEGAGVDGLAKAAGLTSGAFYAYFKSKADAFRETVATGMRELEQAVRTLRAENGAAWVERFVDFYLGEKRTCALTESCALQSLTAEVARADPETRATFEGELRALIASTADGMDGETASERRQRAIALLVLLSGGVSLARAVNSPALSQEIAGAVRAALLSAHTSAPATKRAHRRRQ